VHVPKEIHHTHTLTHTKANNTQKASVAAPLPTDGNFMHIFSARCFLRRGRGTIIIFIVFWVKFCVHDEGLYAAAIGGVALCMMRLCAARRTRSQTRRSFPHPPHMPCGLSLHIKRQHLFVSNFNGRVGCCSSNDSSRAK
jgi:hypothetical protein